MFAKLLKYEWKANAGFMGVMSLAALGVGVMTAVMLRILYAMENRVVVTAAGNALRTIIGIMVLFMVLALVAYWLGMQIMLLRRFYKNKFTDEGYLTFTLPVNSRQIFLSSVLSHVFWTVIATLVIGLAVFTILLFGGNSDELINRDLFTSIRLLWDELVRGIRFMEDGVLVSVLTILYMILSVFYSPVFMLSCITVGAVVANRHKILAAFGIYYVTNMVISVITSIGSVIYLARIFALDASEPRISSIILGAMALELVIMGAGYLLSTRLMKNKLNLP